MPVLSFQNHKCGKIFKGKTNKPTNKQSNKQNRYMFKERT